MQHIRGTGVGTLSQEVIADKETQKHCLKDQGSKFWVVADHKQTQEKSERFYSHRQLGRIHEKL